MIFHFLKIIPDFFESDKVAGDHREHLSCWKKYYIQQIYHAIYVITNVRENDYKYLTDYKHHVHYVKHKLAYYAYHLLHPLHIKTLSS